MVCLSSMRFVLVCLVTPSRYLPSSTTVVLTFVYYGSSLMSHTCLVLSIITPLLLSINYSTSTAHKRLAVPSTVSYTITPATSGVVTRKAPFRCYGVQRLQAGRIWAPVLGEAWRGLTLNRSPSVQGWLFFTFLCVRFWFSFPKRIINNNNYYCK